MSQYTLVIKYCNPPGVFSSTKKMLGRSNIYISQQACINTSKNT